MKNAPFFVKKSCPQEYFSLIPEYQDFQDSVTAFTFRQNPDNLAFPGANLISGL